MNAYIANGPPSVLDSRRGPVRRSRQSPHERMGSWPAHAAHLDEHGGKPRDPLVTAALVRIPLAAHERDTGRRVREDAVERRGRHTPQRLQHVGLDNLISHRALLSTTPSLENWRLVCRFFNFSPTGNYTTAPSLRLRLAPVPHRAHAAGLEALRLSILPRHAVVT